jgi:hypothetical protein
MIKIALQAIAAVMLVLCAIGNALAGDWGNAAIATVAAIAITI